MMGQLIAACDDNGILDMRYQHINQRGERKKGNAPLDTRNPGRRTAKTL